MPTKVVHSLPTAKKTAIYKDILLFVAVWIVLYVFLITTYKYHFSMTEQIQLFVYDWDYVWDLLAEPGGFAMLIGRFLVQFYVNPYIGATVLASVLTLTGVQTALIARRIAPGSDWFLLYLLPVATLFFVQLDFNFRMQGIVAFSIMLYATLVFMQLKELKWQLIYAVIAVPALFILAGSVSMLFGVAIFLITWIKHPEKFYWGFVPLILAAAISYFSVRMAIIGEFRFSFLPDMYCEPKLHPWRMVYFPWGAVLLMILVSWLLRGVKPFKPPLSIVSAFVQIVTLILIVYSLTPQYGGLKSNHYKAIDSYARQGDWGKVLSLCEGKLNNYLYLCNLNIALANLGEIGNKAFFYDQRGPQGMIIDWGNNYQSAVLLCDLHYTIGNIAGARHYAFEGNVINNNESPRMLKRLIQTTLIYGDFRTADRYIRTLEKTLFYRKWAKEQRRFLFNDEAINQDPELGLKRRMMVDVNYLYTNHEFPYVLQTLAEKNPGNRAAIEYLGVLALTLKDVKTFEEWIKIYYGKEDSPALPLSFQEALLIIHEGDTEQWQEMGITGPVAQRFREFKRAILTTQNNPSQASIIGSQFRNTYWFYYMFK